MGCWNQTCGLSGVPIFSGDPVRAVLLHRPSQYDNKALYGDEMLCGVCHASDIWRPMGLVLKGEYDDYGRLENIIDNPASQLFVNIFSKGPLAKAVKPEHLTADILMHALDNYTRGDLNEDIKLDGSYGIMMMAEPIFDAALRSAESIKTWGQKTVREHVLKDIADLREELNDVSELRTEMRMMGFYNTGLYHTLQDVLWRGEIFRAATKELDAYLPAIYELVLFTSAMGHGRKLFTPQSGQGSQNDDMTVQVAIAQATIKYKQDRDDYWKREYGEDADETDTATA